MFCPCPSCNAQSSRSIGPYPATLEQRTALGLVEIHICNNCGIHFAKPLPTQAVLDSFYVSGEYWNKLVSSTSVQCAHTYSQSIQRCAWISAQIGVAPRKVADVGAGQGWMALALGKTWGSDVLCYDFLEPDDKAAQAVKQQSIHFKCYRLGTIPDQPTYDLIFLNQVLEHTVAPIFLLASLRSALQPGAYLYVETPYRDDCFKSNVFPHMLFMDKPAMRQLAKAAGFNIVALEGFGQMPSMGSFYGKALRVSLWLACKFGLRTLANSIDCRMWDYDQKDDGIWLRALLRRPLTSEQRR